MWAWIVVAAAAVLLLLLLLVWLSRRRGGHQEIAAEQARRRTPARGTAEFELHTLAVASRARLEEDWRRFKRASSTIPGIARAAEVLVARVMEERATRTRTIGTSVLRTSPSSIRGRSAYRRGCALLDGVHESPDATETLRQAMRSFRTAFEELLESPAQVGEP